MQKFGELFWGDGTISRTPCPIWDSALLAWTIPGDLGTAAAYLVISAIALIEARRQWLLMPSWLLRLFAASALLCGLSHLLAAWTVFHPAYWLQAGEKVLTAAVSILATAALLFVRAATPGGLTAKWWQQTQALRHELRNARMVINLLRERSGRLPVIWDDDVLNAPIDLASARRKRAKSETKP